MTITIHFNRLTGIASVAGAAAEPIASEKDEPALKRFWETCDDGQPYDIGRAAMDRLVSLGWVEKISPRRRMISELGMAKLGITP